MLSFCHSGEISPNLVTLDWRCLSQDFVLASLVDHLLQKVRKNLNDGHRLAGCQADAVHRRGRVERRLAEASRCAAVAAV